MLDTIGRAVINHIKLILGYHTWNSNVDQKKLIKNPSVIFDIGANVGQTSTTYRRMYPAAQIWAFEPVPDTFSQMASRFKNDNGVHPVPVALGDKQGAAIINRGPKSLTDSMLLRNNRTGEMIEIRTDTVDDFCAANSISSIDILKVDVEGMEARVFAGASAMFRKRAIRLVFAEVFFSPSYQDMPLFWDLHAVLADAGFILYGLYSLIRQPNGYLESANALYTLAD